MMPAHRQTLACCLFIFRWSFVAVDSLVPPSTGDVGNDLFLGLCELNFARHLKMSYFVCSFQLSFPRRTEWFDCPVTTLHARRLLTRRCPLLQFHRRNALPTGILLARLSGQLSRQGGLHSGHQRSLVFCCLSYTFWIWLATTMWVDCSRARFRDSNRLPWHVWDWATSGLRLRFSWSPWRCSRLLDVGWPLLRPDLPARDHLVGTLLVAPLYDRWKHRVLRFQSCLPVLARPWWVLVIMTCWLYCRRLT